MRKTVLAYGRSSRHIRGYVDRKWRTDAGEKPQSTATADLDKACIHTVQLHQHAKDKLISPYGLAIVAAFDKLLELG